MSGPGEVAIDPARLEGDAARIAFWVNAYNDRLRSVMDERRPRGHLFRHRRIFREPFEVGGLTYTLDVIEHGLLRGNARPPYALRPLLRAGDPRRAAAPARPDPRVHFALNCGARSCPPLRRYSSERLDQELERASRAYLAAESALDRKSMRLTLPGLVKLYRSDFGGDEDLVEMAADALGGEDAAWIRARAGELRIGYSRFDWRLA